jgi:hypothetical protein
MVLRPVARCDRPGCEHPAVWRLESRDGVLRWVLCKEHTQEEQQREEARRRRRARRGGRRTTTKGG